MNIGEGELIGVTVMDLVTVGVSSPAVLVIVIVTTTRLGFMAVLVKCRYLVCKDVLVEVIVDVNVPGDELLVEDEVLGDLLAGELLVVDGLVDEVLVEDEVLEGLLIEDVVLEDGVVDDAVVVEEKETWFQLDISSPNLHECIRRCYGYRFCYSLTYDHTREKPCIFYLHASDKCHGKELINLNEIEYKNKPVSVACLKCGEPKDTNNGGKKTDSSDKPGK